MQDVIDKIKDAERRAEAAERRIQDHERDAAGLFTRVAVLEGRYSDLKQTLDGVVQTQGAQGERLSAVGSDIKGLGNRIDILRDDLKSITARVWAGSAAGAGGTGAAALVIWFLSQRAGG